MYCIFAVLLAIKPTIFKLYNMLSTKTNSVAKTVNTKTVKKVVAKRKPQTEAQKQATAKKRALNPQFANVQSAKRRTEKDAFKTDAILCLLEVKRTAGLTNVNTKSYKNIVYQNECKNSTLFLSIKLIAVLHSF